MVKIHWKGPAEDFATAFYFIEQIFLVSLFFPLNKKILRATRVVCRAWSSPPRGGLAPCSESGSWPRVREVLAVFLKVRNHSAMQLGFPSHMFSLGLFFFLSFKVFSRVQKLWQHRASHILMQLNDGKLVTSASSRTVHALKFVIPQCLGRVLCSHSLRVWLL